MQPARLVIGMTGASGAIFGIRLLEALRDHSTMERHLILSHWAEETIRLETDYSPRQVRGLADVVYEEHQMDAAVSSGSFSTMGMVILPCSMKTLSAIANGFDYNLMVRAADVTLKERRRLVLCPRETPLNTIHLENMLKLSRLGVQMVPPMPSFYHRPRQLEDIIRYHVARVLDQFQIETAPVRRWGQEPHDEQLED